MNDLFAKRLKSVSSDMKVFLGFCYAEYVGDDFKNYSLSYVIPKDILKEKNIVEHSAHIGNLYLLNKSLKDYSKEILLKESLETSKILEQVDLYPKDDSLEKFKDKLFDDNDFLNLLKTRSKDLVSRFLDTVEESR
jgi:hypothetical protein